MADKYLFSVVTNEQGDLQDIYPETSADIVQLADADGNYEATNVEGALSEIAGKVSTLEGELAEAGKVDDVQDVNGNSVVVNKIAKLTKAAVGLGNVDNTADADKTVKHAGTADESTKVSNKLAIKGTATNGAEYDGAMPIALVFKDDDFGISRSSATGTTTVTVNINDKGYATKTEVDNQIATVNTELSKKYDKTGGTISGDVVISGNLVVGGDTTTVNSKQLEVEDSLITVAKGNVLPLTSPAGLVVPKADGTNDVALVVDNSNMAKVGKVTLKADGTIDEENSDLQTLATRLDDEDLTDGSLMKWNATDKTLESDTRQFAEKNVNETISGDWTFSNTNGFKTNAIENRDGNRIFDYNGTENRFGSEAKPTIIRGSASRPQYLENGGTSKDIALIEDITGGEITIDDAKNVTTSINGKAITDIFETNGTTVKNATNVTGSINGKAITDIFESGSATVKKASLAETANVANKVANKLTVSGKDASLTYDGDDPKEVAFNTSNFSATATTDKITMDLANTGVTAGTYTAVTVDAKGRATSGGLAFQLDDTGAGVSPQLMVGGLYGKKIG